MNRAATKKGEPPYAQLDKGICRIVKILFENGIETVESCEGGKGHFYSRPTVVFCGHYDQGFKAVHIALENGLPVWQLRRRYMMVHGELTGPLWEIVFLPD